LLADCLPNESPAAKSPTSRQRSLIHQWHRNPTNHLSFSANSVYSPHVQQESITRNSHHTALALYHPREQHDHHVGVAFRGSSQSRSSSPRSSLLGGTPRKLPMTMERKILKRCHYSDLSHRFQRHSQELQSQLSARGSVGTNSNESTPSRTEGKAL